MYNNVEKFVLAGVILCIGSLFFLVDQSEEVELSDNISESFSNEGTVDVEITSLLITPIWVIQSMMKPWLQKQCQHLMIMLNH